MQDLIHASEVYAESNFRVAMVAVNPFNKGQQIPRLKYIGEWIETNADWYRQHTNLDIHPNERCFSVHTLYWVRLEDGKKYHVSYLFLSQPGTMTPEDWDLLINEKPLIAYGKISLRVFPDPNLEADQPRFQYAPGKDPVLVVRVRNSLRYVVGAAGWRMKLLNSVSEQDMKAIVIPLGRKLEKRTKEATKEEK